MGEVISMGVYDILKNNNIPKIVFAKDFDLSRPTLDEYIDLFDSGKKIQKEKYSVVFNSLFENNLSPHEFKKRYVNLKRIYNRDILLHLESLDTHNTDCITQIVEELRESVDCDTQKSELLPFVYYIVTSYRTDRLCKALLSYFNELNGVTSKELSEFEKSYFGSLFDINCKFLDDPCSLDSSNYNRFVKKKQIIEASKRKKTIEIRNEINEVIDKYVNEIVASSRDDEDKHLIIERVIKKMNSEDFDKSK